MTKQEKTEVLKAFENCVNGKNCKDCPYLNKTYTQRCNIKKLHKQVLEIVKESNNDLSL